MCCRHEEGGVAACRTIETHVATAMTFVFTSLQRALSSNVCLGAPERCDAKSCHLCMRHSDIVCIHAWSADLKCR